MATKKSGRDSAMELLRIITMLGVVILHYNNGSVGGGFLYAAEGSANQYYLFFTENLFICAVNLFVLISAYYLSATGERRFSKAAELLLQVILFRLVFFAVRVLRGGGFTWKALALAILPSNYYVILYITLYLLSPYVNLLLQRLSVRQYRRLLLLCGLLFSLWTILGDVLANWNGGEINGLSTVGMYGSQHGYSIVNFLLIYLLGAYFRMHEVTLPGKKAALGASVCFTVMLCTSLLEHFLGMRDTATWYYNNPFVIAMAAFVFLFFRGLRLDNPFINTFARGAFTCFLFHGSFMKHLSVERMAAMPLPLFALHQLGCAVGLYLLSCAVDAAYRFCTEWFLRRLRPVLDRVDVSVRE